MKKVKQFGRKIQEYLLMLYKRKELLIDTLCVTLSVFIITFLPMLYMKIELLPIRVILTLLLLALVAVAVVFLVMRLVERNLVEGYGCVVKWRMVVGVLVVAMLIWLGSNIIVKLVHPSLTGVYAVGMTEQQKNIITMVNSVLFVLYSQILITLCTCANFPMREFLDCLGRVLVCTFVPLGILIFLSVLFVNLLFGQASAGKDVLNAMLTSFLWITSIAANESIVKKQKSHEKECIEIAEDKE